MGTYVPNPVPPFPTSLTIPDDGSPEQVGSVNVTMEALADAIANVRADLHKTPWRCVDRYSGHLTPSGTWNVASYVGTPELLLAHNFAGYQAGDIFVVTAQLTAAVATGVSGWLKMYYTTISANAVDCTVPFDSGGEVGPFGAGASGDTNPTSIHGVVAVPGFTLPGQFTVALQGRTNPSGGGNNITDNFGINSTQTGITLEVWRNIP